MQVKVTVPRNVSLEKAREFAESRKEWIQKHLDRYTRIRDNTIWPDLDTIDFEKAQRELFARLDELSHQYNLPYRRAAFRKQKTLWGSCSSNNDISLNINLIFLPTHLQDYVLLHELTHTRHRNHGVRFWAALNKLTQNQARQLDRELSRQMMRL